LIFLKHPFKQTFAIKVRKDRNLAVPTTNIPVSVETIRDNTYNSNCPSANQATLVHTTLVVLDLQLILMDKRSKMLAASGLDITHIESN
jgi:hypothetical protein